MLKIDRNENFIIQSGQITMLFIASFTYRPEYLFQKWLQFLYPEDTLHGSFLSQSGCPVFSNVRGDVWNETKGILYFFHGCKFTNQSRNAE